MRKREIKRIVKKMLSQAGIYVSPKYKDCEIRIIPDEKKQSNKID